MINLIRQVQKHMAFKMVSVSAIIISGILKEVTNWGGMPMQVLNITGLNIMI